MADPAPLVATSYTARDDLHCEVPADAANLLVDCVTEVARHHTHHADRQTAELVRVPTNA